MVFASYRQRLNLPVAPLAAALVGGVTALAFAMMPVGILEDFVIDSGIAAVMPAAEPPLGATARAVLILAGGGGIALITWFTLLLLVGARAIVIQRSDWAEGEEGAPVLRRADAHPDAPARRPLFANRDLGTPFLEVRADRPVHITAEMPEEAEHAEIEFAPRPIERDIPADLDTPLAALDPDAIPASPVAWFPKRTVPLNNRRPQNGPADLETPVAANADVTREPPGSWFPTRAAPLNAPRQQLFDPGERFETFELTPPAPSPALTPAPAPEPAPTPAAVQVSPPVPAQTSAPAPVQAPVPASAPAPELVQRLAPAQVPAPEPVQRLAPARPRDSARVELDPSASIHALLDRLERSVARREVKAPPPPPAHKDSLEETLGTLRRLAAGR